MLCVLKLGIGHAALILPTLVWPTQHMISILFGCLAPERAFARLSHVVLWCGSRAFISCIRRLCAFPPRYIHLCLIFIYSPVPYNDGSGLGLGITLLFCVLFCNFKWIMLTRTDT